MITQEQAKKFVRDISIGLTCSRCVSLYAIVGNIIITHHKGHMEYWGYGSGYCPVEYRFFKFDDNINYSGNEYMDKQFMLYKMGGRISKKKKKELMEKAEELNER